jgi:hypothetical protein
LAVSQFVMVDDARCSSRRAGHGGETRAYSTRLPQIADVSRAQFAEDVAGVVPERVVAGRVAKEVLEMLRYGLT